MHRCKLKMSEEHSGVDETNSISSTSSSQIKKVCMLYYTLDNIEAATPLKKSQRNEIQEWLSEASFQSKEQFMRLIFEHANYVDAFDFGCYEKMNLPYKIKIKDNSYRFGKFSNLPPKLQQIIYRFTKISVNNNE